MDNKQGVMLERLRKLMDESQSTRETIAKAFDCDRTITPEFIIKYAEYFNVSTDYLLGLSNVKSTDKAVQFISKHTGLSDRAIELLQKYKKKEAFINHINSMIENPELYDLFLDTIKDKGDD